MTACLEYMPWFRVAGKPYLLSVKVRSRQLRQKMPRQPSQQQRSGGGGSSVQPPSRRVENTQWEARTALHSSTKKAMDDRLQTPKHPQLGNAFMNRADVATSSACVVASKAVYLTSSSNLKVCLETEACDVDVYKHQPFLLVIPLRFCKIEYH
ncbi:hypothetical protein PVK06_048569 [Gossypium arboreum]|uniref:Uncharacterized protein n=1 Tax=Gossypium arboreum TaxID=29729 RepID=A0ABR0MG78_GOSAR|nr:hypothetical protein PVK06_048569 [Gossypium arboreum]